METTMLTQPATVGEWVAENFRTAEIFQKHKIDFCCKGNRTLQEVCQEKGLNEANLLKELKSVSAGASHGDPDFRSWPIDLLADYIVKIHHSYVEKAINNLQPYLDKVAKVHGERHPELWQIRKEFMDTAAALAMHMKKEELILFPYIRRLANDKVVSPPSFGTVENPIAMMLHEHDTEGERFRRISELSNDYTPPEDACNTYRVAFAMLKEFEQDLHRHIHLENNILFPNALHQEQVTFDIVDHH